MKCKAIALALVWVHFATASASAGSVLLASLDNRVFRPASAPADPEVSIVLQITDLHLPATIGLGVLWRGGEVGSVEISAANDPAFARFSQLATDGIDDVLSDGVFWARGGVLFPSPESVVFGRAPDLVGNDLDFVRIITHAISFEPITYQSGLEGFFVDYDATYEFYGHAVPESETMALLAIGALSVYWRKRQRRRNVRTRFYLGSWAVALVVCLTGAHSFASQCRDSRSTGTNNLHGGFSLPKVVFTGAPSAVSDVTINLTIIADFGVGNGGVRLDVGDGTGGGSTPPGFFDIFADEGNHCSFPKSGSVTLSQSNWNIFRNGGVAGRVDFQLTSSVQMADCTPGVLSESALIEVVYQFDPCANCSPGKACCAGGSTCVSCCNDANCPGGQHCCSNQCRECCFTFQCDDGDVCTGTDTCVSGNCNVRITDCNVNLVEDFCDIGNGTSNDCDGDMVPDECQGGSVGAALMARVPDHNETLPRVDTNTMWLTFACDIQAPTAGDVLIQELLTGGSFGTDLGGSFTFSVLNTAGGFPRILKIVESTQALTHRKWYAVRNTGSWSSAQPFEVHYLVQMGDADNDLNVNFADLSFINTSIATFAPVPDTSSAKT